MQNLRWIGFLGAVGALAVWTGSNGNDRGSSPRASQRGHDTAPPFASAAKPFDDARFLTELEAKIAAPKSTTAKNELSLDPSPAGRTRIVSWNIEWYPGRGQASTPAEKLVHVTHAREIVSALAPDILCVQEVRNKAAVDELAEALPGFQTWVISQFAGSQQIAILSKTPPVAAYFKRFQTRGASPPRGFAFCAYREGDDYLLVYSVHLKSNRGGIDQNIGKREESARQLVEHIEGIEADLKRQGAKHIEVVLAGDFNTDPGDPRFGAEKTASILKGAGMSWGWEGVPNRQRTTWPADGTYPDACFDHFYYRGIGDPENLLIVGSEAASDHRAIALTLDQL